MGTSSPEQNIMGQMKVKSSRAAVLGDIRVADAGAGLGMVLLQRKTWKLRLT
jgi:hypothetical protein